tara:strand:+ start:244 stop:477 length:234 start_codon:yes stop_codon:yes gene_type:complete
MKNAPALRLEIIGIFFKILDEEDSIDPAEEICDDETLERVLESISSSWHNTPLDGGDVREIVLDVWCKISRWMCGDY